MQFPVILISLAAASNPATSQIATQPHRSFDIKGIAPGISFDEWRGKISGAKFSCTDSRGDQGIDKGCELTDGEKCLGNNPSLCHPQAKRDTFAANQVIFRYLFHADVLWEIDINGLRPESFDEVESAMESKFGTPVIKRNPVQNRMGATFHDATALWSGVNGVVVYKKYADDLDLPSKLTVFSTEGWKAWEKSVTQRSDAAKSDM